MAMTSASSSCRCLLACFVVVVKLHFVYFPTLECCELKMQTFAQAKSVAMFAMCNRTREIIRAHFWPFDFFLLLLLALLIKALIKNRFWPRYNSILTFWTSIKFWVALQLRIDS